MPKSVDLFDHNGHCWNNLRQGLRTRRHSGAVRPIRRWSCGDPGECPGLWEIHLNVCGVRGHHENWEDILWQLTVLWFRKKSIQCETYNVFRSLGLFQKFEKWGQKTYFNFRVRCNKVNDSKQLLAIFLKAGPPTLFPSASLCASLQQPLPLLPHQHGQPRPF